MKSKIEDIESNLDASKKFKRIDKGYIIHEIQHLLHLEKGFIFTIKQLLIRPGKAIREFIHNDRDKYVKPIIFLIFTSLIFTLIANFSQIEYSFFNIDRIEPLQGKIKSKEIGYWTNSHIGYTNLIMGLFIGIWIKFFFRKSNYNIFELLVLLCFILGEAIFILGIFLILAKFLKIGFIASIGIMFYFTYTIWAVGQFFGEKKLSSYIKSLISYILGCSSYLITLILLAYILKNI